MQNFLVILIKSSALMSFIVLGCAIVLAVDSYPKKSDFEWAVLSAFVINSAGLIAIPFYKWKR